MVYCYCLLFTVLTFQFAVTSTLANYEPNWESLDARPIPTWYDEAKLGIFIHWGVFSVMSYGSEWTWYNWREKKDPELLQFIERTYPKDVTYQDFAKDFTAELFDPDKWVEIIRSSGAKYVVLTSKHHEGYTLWPSKYSFSWNSMDVGPKRDLVGELKAAVEKYPDLKFGLYHSLYEWYNPLYLADKAKNFTNLSHPNFAGSKIVPEMIELIEKYKPNVLWSDGEWEAPAEYWHSLKFLAWLYNESPVKDSIVTNDRWGHDTLCNHGGVYTCADRYNPGVLQKKKFETAMTIDKKSWGYRRTATLNSYLTVDQIIRNLTMSVSCGGNLLLNVGPTKDGTIPPIYEERLHQLGLWMNVNGEAIYKSKPWAVCQNDSYTSGVWYTTNKAKTILYATFYPWPVNNLVTLKCPEFTRTAKVQMLGVSGYLEYLNSAKFVKIKLPDKANVANDWVWTLKIVGVQNMKKDKGIPWEGDVIDGTSMQTKDGKGENEKYETSRERDFDQGISVTTAQDRL